MPNIIFVNRFFYPDISATSQLLSDLAFGLAEKGCRVQVVTSRMRYDDERAVLPKYEVIRGVTVHRVNTTRMGRARNRHQIVDYSSFFIMALWVLVRVTKRGDTVVAKTDPPLLSVPLVLMARLFGARLVNWLQDAFPETAMVAGVTTRSRLLDRWLFGSLRAVRNRSLRASTATVVLGERMRAYFVACGVPDARLHTIANWADTAVVYPVAPADNALRRDWGLANHFVVGYSGNMGLAHDFRVVLKAAALLANDDRIRFLVVGAGKRMPHVMREVQALGLTNVLFKPYQPREVLAQSLSVPDVHLVSLLPAMEGFVVPSKFYGVAAVGRPTLYLGDTDGEVARDLARHDCGTAVRNDDAEALVTAIMAYADDPERTQREGASALALAHAQFSREVALEKWVALLAPGG